jgi:hypothetical protein
MNANPTSYLLYYNRNRLFVAAAAVVVHICSSHSASLVEAASNNLPRLHIQLSGSAGLHIYQLPPITQADAIE